MNPFLRPGSPDTDSTVSSALAASCVGAALLLLGGCHTTCRCVLHLPAPASAPASSVALGPSFMGPDIAGGPAPVAAPRYVGMLDRFTSDSGGDADGLNAHSGLAQVSFTDDGADFDPEISPDGRWLTYASTRHAETSDIYRKQVDGRTMTRLTSDPAEDAMPSVSPDGRWITFASDRTGNWDVWMMPAEGGPATQLTFESDDELHPSFCPEGDRIAYSRHNGHTGRWEIWSFEIARPGVRTYVCDGLFPRWSPDPSRSSLLFQRARERGSRFYGVWTVEFTDGGASSPTEIVSATDAAIMHPAWSPDGRRICFSTVVRPRGTTAWSEVADLWVIGVDGTGRSRLTAGRFRNLQPTWSPDGRIYFVSDRGGSECLWSLRGSDAGVRLKDDALAVGADDSAD